MSCLCLKYKSYNIPCIMPSLLNQRTPFHDPFNPKNKHKLNWIQLELVSKKVVKIRCVCMKNMIFKMGLLWISMASSLEQARRTSFPRMVTDIN